MATETKTQKTDIQKLAALARIRVGEEELPKFTKEFDAIVAYVGQLESLNVSPDSRADAPVGSPTKASGPPVLRNVMREDNEPHESGKYTEALAEQFPAFAKATAGKPADKAGSVYLEVKQIIKHE